MTADLPLSQLGQTFRTRGLCLDITRLRRAIERGVVPARRVGSRWFVTPEVAEAFTRPLAEQAVAA